MIAAVKMCCARIAGLIGCLMLVGFFGLEQDAAHASEVDLADVLPFKQRELATDNVLLSLSIDEKSVAAAYRAGPYDRTKDYPGYFNHRKCYTYTSNVFVITANADGNHECSKAFSGNFMNWASTSTLDLMRYGLTGGDRITDDTSQTVLQRAVLPATFYANAVWFPSRTISAVNGGNVSLPSAVTPFTDSAIHIVSCDNRILLSATAPAATAPAACATADSAVSTTYTAGAAIGASARVFLLHVKVCDSNEAVERTDLCQQFGTRYKPVGVLQKKSARMRFAVMSYLADTTAARYGGVLRSPMKYLGPKKVLVPSFGDADNEFKEWDPATGILYANPDTPADRDSTTLKSGVLNYINQFGRAGIYRSHDPVGELFYEGLRYFQAKPPTANATSGTLTPAMRDGFPVLTTWTDPMTSSCQKNQIVTIADAVSNWDFHLPGNTRAKMQNGITVPRPPSRPIETTAAGKVAEPNAMTWTETVGKMEVNAGNAYSNPSPNSRLANLHIKDTGDLDYATYYISGLAYWANTQAIRVDYPTARVKTMVIDIDRDGNGTITMPTRKPMPKDSQLFLAAKYGGYTDFTEDANPFTVRALEPETPIPGSDDEWDGNGDDVPDRYFLASQPGTMVSAIHKIAALPTIFSGSALTGATLSSVQVAPTATYLFQAGFDSYRWSGRLEKRKITANASTGTLTLASTPDWDAGVLLTGNGPLVAPNPSPSDRAIYIGAIAADNALKAIPFNWADLPEGHQTLLNRSPVTGEDDGVGERRLNFLRGRRDTALAAGGNLRNRTSVLGDIVNSNVVYVGAPATTIVGTGYQNFYNAHKARTAAVYVGANDGMLHAFRADTGVELFAYIPLLMLPKISRLTVPDYPHEAYVDGQIAVAEARIGSSTWATVLAAGFGGGAQGVFALDVTNPVPPAGAAGAAGAGGGITFGDGFNSAGRPAALFEFSDSDDKDMGNLLAAPAIAKFRISVVNGVPQYKYFVVVTSGVNNAKEDGTNAAGVAKYNPDAPGAVFLLSLEKPRTQAWELGVNYYKILLPAADAEIQNGVAPPALVLGADGAVRLAYVGDLQGRLWRLDFRGNAPWSTARSTTPLFLARDASNRAQPITQRPRVVFAPEGGYVVLFGTGKYMETTDVRPSEYRGQSFYAIYDNVEANYTVARSELALRTLSASGAAYTITGDNFVYGNLAPAKKGWYVDFLGTATSGERSVTDPVITNGQVAFTSVSPGNDVCAPGSGRTYVLDALSGLAGTATVGQVSSVGLPGAPLTLQVGNVIPGNRNSVGRRASSVKTAIVNTGVGVARGSAAISLNGAQTRTVPSGRFSWREIFNWMELRGDAN